MDAITLARYLGLFHCQELPVSCFSRLLTHLGSIDKILEQPEQKYLEMGLKRNQVEAINKVKNNINVDNFLENTLLWADKSLNSIICFESKQYPACLREIYTPPPLLFAIGDPVHLSTEMVAIVGSRRSSSQGDSTAYWMAYELAQAGLGIVSGLARGIDSRAHEGALAAGAPTIAVMATGPDRLYPKSNQKLAARISEQGVLLTEFPLGSEPLPRHFPTRNRIITGLSRGTLVVEATLKSGSLISCRLAMEQNREVFAVPGPISSQHSRGCHSLIKQGARLVETPQDVLSELDMFIPGVDSDEDKNESKTIETKKVKEKSPCQRKLDGSETGRDRQKQEPEETRILEAIGDQACLLETLVERTGLDLSDLNNRLLQLEIQGQIVSEGGRYVRVSVPLHREED